VGGAGLDGTGRVSVGRGESADEQARLRMRRDIVKSGAWRIEILI